MRAPHDGPWTGTARRSLDGHRSNRSCYGPLLENQIAQGCCACLAWSSVEFEIVD